MASPADSDSDDSVIDELNNNNNQPITSSTQNAQTFENYFASLRNNAYEFVDPALEKLYQAYNIKQKRCSMLCFILSAIAFDIYALVTGFPSNTAVMLLFAFVNVLLCVWSHKPYKWYSFALPLIACTIVELQIVCDMYLKGHILPNENLGWVFLFIHLVYAVMPFTMHYCVMFGVMFTATYQATFLILYPSELGDFIIKCAANCLLLGASNIIGLIMFILVDDQQRNAFLETRQSLKMKLSVEEESAEQERLLLSVLPEHVAVKMRQDLGAALDTQFKKIYMSRHENVSILYADIVGFTAISSTYSASELVKILNELFARFDRLSEKYHQLRIKILGDCYYCISGAPIERQDHAILSVHMGLSMVEAIKYVQQTTNSPVDMRVGIHTGAVLAGVLGQRQWQFDVYSKDVELANKMESSGLPGRVHVSEKTLSYLNDEFEVEPAHGEDREEILRLAGIKTYFIVKALKPYKEMVVNGNHHSSMIDMTGSKENSLVMSDPDSSTRQRRRQDSEEFKLRLKKELMNRDGYKKLSKQTGVVTFAFHDNRKEKEYQKYILSLLQTSLYGCSVACISAFVLVLTITRLQFMANINFSNLIKVIIVLIAFLSPVQIYITNPERIKSPWSKYLGIFTCVNSIVLFDVIGLEYSNFLHNLLTESSEDPTNDQEQLINNIRPFSQPSYMTHCCVLLMISITMVIQASHSIKSVLLLLVVIFQWILNCLCMEPFVTEEITMHGAEHYSAGSGSLCLLIFDIALCLILIMRHMEKSSRILFLWKIEVEEQREKASDIVHRNEALVYNILPKHVAAHFLGDRKRHYDELYSQSYAEVGVLFASMPNFADFYSEESVNNQGLECLRFLNEVISDFDAILQQERFHDIIKIKTIGSTYMAASGLNLKHEIKPEDPIEIRWAHLALLVEFALELKKALKGINEQSFNHFTLQMGINHGPIIAGVIGARKPHYDIWGNSVNVASRMESTGRAGCIQVTEETCKILQHFGYKFEQRGLVAVKGKGKLMTYYLIGKNDGEIFKSSIESLNNESNEYNKISDVVPNNITSSKNVTTTTITASKTESSNGVIPNNNNININTDKSFAEFHNIDNNNVGIYFENTTFTANNSESISRNDDPRDG